MAVLAVAACLSAASPARAVEAINVRVDTPAIDLTSATEQVTTTTDRIQVSTAPGADGIVRRIEVRAREGGTHWAVFALTNNGDEQIDRLIVVPHYRMVGSGLFWPDLGLSRIVAITPSTGDRPLRQESHTADIFRVTLDPGTVITFVAEMRTEKLPQIYLWDPDAYKDKVNSFTLYYGIVIGIAGLLALFLTILFVVKGSIMFPAAAALGWAVLMYIGIDFGFWGKVFDMSAGAERIWRASGEAILSATLLVFLFAYLNLSRWHVRYAQLTLAWLTALAALVGVALFDPAVASGIARMSLAAIAVLGLGLVIYLSMHGYDRAVLLIPTWILLVVWTFGAGLAVTGLVTNDIIGPALLGGLVLIVMLIGFTVMQHAFAGGVTHGIVSDVERRALALDRRRRPDLGLGRLRRQGVHQPGDRAPARPQARHAGRRRGELARGAASARPRPLPRRARQRAGAAARPADPGFPPAHRRRALSLVHAEGAPGGRLRRRGGARGRHAHRRHRVQERRGTAAVRRGARQPHRPAQPRTVHRPHGGGLRLRPLRYADQALGAGDRSRPLQAGQRFGRHRGRRFHPAHHRAPALPPAQAAGHAGAALRRPVRADPVVGDASRRASSPSPRRCAARCARRSPSTTARSSSPPRSGWRSPRTSRTAPRKCSRTPSWRCITPSASAATASRFSSRPCARARPTG